jgi:hypothetical protein
MRGGDLLHLSAASATLNRALATFADAAHALTLDNRAIQNALVAVGNSVTPLDIQLLSIGHKNKRVSRTRAFYCAAQAGSLRACEYVYAMTRKCDSSMVNWDDVFYASIVSRNSAICELAYKWFTEKKHECCTEYKRESCCRDDAIEAQFTWYCPRGNLDRSGQAELVHVQMIAFATRLRAINICALICEWYTRDKTLFLGMDPRHRMIDTAIEMDDRELCEIAFSWKTTPNFADFVGLFRCAVLRGRYDLCKMIIQWSREAHLGVSYACMIRMVFQCCSETRALEVCTLIRQWHDADEEAYKTIEWNEVNDDDPYFQHSKMPSIIAFLDEWERTYHAAH